MKQVECQYIILEKNHRIQTRYFKMLQTEKRTMKHRTIEEELCKFFRDISFHEYNERRYVDEINKNLFYLNKFSKRKE